MALTFEVTGEIPIKVKVRRDPVGGGDSENPNTFHSRDPRTRVMNTLFWVLAGLLAYSLAALVLKQRGLLPGSVRLQGPLTTVHTKRGRVFLDWLAQPRRLWRAWANLGVGIALVIMVGTFVTLIWQGIAILRRPPAPTAVNQPRNFLVIPGVNEFLPLSVAPEILLGLLVGLVVHEGGHGLLCRVENIRIESMGIVLLTILPIGAFVEPDEESQRAADRGGRTRMFAAGVTNNFAVTAIAFALLFGPVIGSIGVAAGVPIAGAYGGTPAADTGISNGDRITAIDGQNVSSEYEMDRTLIGSDARTVDVTIDGERTVAVTRSLSVVGTIGDNPADLTVRPQDDPIEVTAVNGTAVDTRAGFRSAVGNETFARISTSEGERVIPVGAYIAGVSDGGPMNQSGIPTNQSLIVLSIDGNRVTSSHDLQAVLDETNPGETVPVRIYRDGEVETKQVALGRNEADGNGFLGVTVFPGSSGLLLTDFGVQTYPAGTYLELLGGEGGEDAALPAPVQDLMGTTLGRVYIALVLPLASLVIGIPNFPGFTGPMLNFYTVSSPLGGLTFLLANALFWTAWINLQLGLFNCIPGYPLDGGRILRTSTEAVVSRLPVDRPDALVRTVTTSVGLAMLAALLLMIFGPSLLAG
jgi:membrane-associated protease RseP (regulator of RpoE activity)